MITPAFSNLKLKQMLTPIERITANFIDHLRPMAASGKVFDLKKYIGSFAMDTIAIAGYGISLDSLSEPNHPVVVNARKILSVDASFSMIICTQLPGLARMLRLEPFDRKAVQYFDDLTSRIIERRLANGPTTKRKTFNLLRNIIFHFFLILPENTDLLGLMMEKSENYSDKDYNQNLTESPTKSLSKDELSGQGILFFVSLQMFASLVLMIIISFFCFF